VINTNICINTRDATKSLVSIDPVCKLFEHLWNETRDWQRAFGDFPAGKQWFRQMTSSLFQSRADYKKGLRKLTRNLAVKKLDSLCVSQDNRSTSRCMGRFYLKLSNVKRRQFDPNHKALCWLMCLYTVKWFRWVHIKSLYEDYEDRFWEGVWQRSWEDLLLGQN